MTLSVRWEGKTRHFPIEAKEGGLFYIGMCIVVVYVILSVAYCDKASIGYVILLFSKVAGRQLQHIGMSINQCGGFVQ